jgi:hypothetical protein
VAIWLFVGGSNAHASEKWLDLKLLLLQLSSFLQYVWLGFCIFNDACKHGKIKGVWVESGVGRRGSDAG